MQTFCFLTKIHFTLTKTQSRFSYFSSLIKSAKGTLHILSIFMQFYFNRHSTLALLKVFLVYLVLLRQAVLSELVDSYARVCIHCHRKILQEGVRFRVV